MNFKTKLLLTLFLLVVPIFSVFAEDTEKESVSIEIGNDFYSAGSLVELLQPAEDDAYLAGAAVNVSQSVENDLVVAGSTITIDSLVGDDLRAAGSVITLTSKVGGDALVAGGVVNILSNAELSGDAFITGGMLNFSGSADQDLQLIGDEINFSGKVLGDLEIHVGDRITFGRDAKVTGKLIYSSEKEIEIPTEIASSVERKDSSITDSMKLGFAKESGIILDKVFMLCVMFVAGAVLLALAGRSSEIFADTIREKFWWSLLTGSLIFFAPFLAILLLITIVGSYFAGIFIAAWILTLLVAGALTGFVLGSLFIKQDKNTKYSKKLLTLLVGLLAILLISLIPGFGGILKLTIFVVVLGVFVLSKIQLYKSIKKAKLV